MRESKAVNVDKWDAHGVGGTVNNLNGRGIPKEGDIKQIIKQIF